MCASDDSSCLLFVPLVECSSIPGLIRTPPDSSPPVASHVCPDISSTTSVAWSQCSPIPIRSCVDSPHTNHTRQNHKVAWCLRRGHKGRRSRSLGIRLMSVLCNRAIRVQVHSQISCLTPHSVSPCSMVMPPALPTVFRVRQPNSVQPHIRGYNVSESPYAMLTWLHQAIHRRGNCLTLLTSQMLTEAAWHTEERSYNHCSSEEAISVVQPEYVFVAFRYPARYAHAPYCHLWPAPAYSIFPHYLINGTILERKL
jgi:hypothetical protein